MTPRPVIVDGAATRTVVRNASAPLDPGIAAPALDLVRDATDLVLPGAEPRPAPGGDADGSAASPNAVPAAEPRRS